MSPMQWRAGFKTWLKSKGPRRERRPETMDSSAWQACRQGDIVPISSLSVLAVGKGQTVDLPHGAAVISQTCDVVLPDRLNIVVAKVVQLDGSEASEARNGSRSRYVELPNYQKDKFVDLEYIATHSKHGLNPANFERGIDQSKTKDVRSFATRVARRFGRFAFPDQVVPWLAALQDVVKSKHDKTRSPVGRALKEVVELRVEAADWESEPLDLTLHVIVKGGTLPELTDEELEAPDNVLKWLRPKGNLTQSASDIAGLLFRDELGTGHPPTAKEKYHLWLAFGEALGLLCKPKGPAADEASVQSAVRTISGVVVADDEFTLVQHRRSEMLDLDHLSTPVPLS